jgi:hypothetical protein
MLHGQMTSFYSISKLRSGSAGRRVTLIMSFTLRSDMESTRNTSEFRSRVARIGRMPMLSRARRTAFFDNAHGFFMISARSSSHVRRDGFSTIAQSFHKDLLALAGSSDDANRKMNKCVCMIIIGITTVEGSERLRNWRQSMQAETLTSRPFIPVCSCRPLLRLNWPM